MRFATRLELGDKIHEVSRTAQRLVQRMKKDSIHSGRRPSGLCGAALLLAARMHDFNRTPLDIVKIVKVHESTLRKRLMEFGETPSSVLTVEEFMTIDLEAEQDPPAFKAARRRDKEMIQRLGDQELTELQREIESKLDNDTAKRKRSRYTADVPEEVPSEEQLAQKDTEKFIADSTLETIKGCLDEEKDKAKEGETEPELVMEVESEAVVSGIAPDVMAMCNAEHNTKVIEGEEPEIDADTILDGLEDDEINSYILTEAEAKHKGELWRALNAEYLEQVRDRQERLDREREDGKPEKKRKKQFKKKTHEQHATAGEAIEKILQEKKISTKINYDILKSLNDPGDKETVKVEEQEQEAAGPSSQPSLMLPSRRKISSNLFATPKSKKPFVGLLSAMETDVEPKLEKVVETGDTQPAATEEEPEEEREVEVEPAGHSSLATMLNEGDDDDIYGGYDEEY